MLFNKLVVNIPLVYNSVQVYGSTQETVHHKISAFSFEVGNIHLISAPIFRESAKKSSSTNGQAINASPPLLMAISGGFFCGFP